LPADAQLSFFGCAFATAINSFTLAASTPGLVNRSCGLAVASEIGAKSRKES
jgi:hypothetical protein